MLELNYDDMIWQYNWLMMTWSDARIEITMKWSDDRIDF